MKEKIVITGASSFIGSNLLKYLENYDVYCLVRKKIEIHNCKQVIFTINDEEVIRESLQKVNYIIHIAGVTDPNDKAIEQVNIKFTELLVDQAKKSDLKNFIFISTSHINYMIKDKYTESKAKAEEIIKKNLAKYLIIRPGIVYGRGEKKSVGKIVSLIRKSKIVPIIGDGKSKLNLVFVGDLVKLILRGIEENFTGLYTLSSPDSISFNELIDLIAQKLNKKIVKIYLPIGLLKFPVMLYQNLSHKPIITTQQLTNLRLDRDIIKNEFDFPESTGINKGLADTL